MNDESSFLASARAGLEAAVANAVVFLPKLLLFTAILVVGYFVAKLLGKLLDRILERVRFDEVVERGGVRQALSRTGWDASDILGKLLFYTLFLFVLQLAFGVFGPNPISDLLTRLIAYLPNVLVAIVIVIVASAIAAGVKKIVSASLGGLSYGNLLATISSVAILVIGIFAALDQLDIAPNIVNGLFYAVLAIVVGSSIVAIGGGGISVMRSQWERLMNRAKDRAETDIHTGV